MQEKLKSLIFNTGLQMEFKSNCKHEWETIGNHLVCSKCNKSKLKLEQINKDLMQGTRDDGKSYSVRIDKNRYFYPDEWIKFYDNLNSKNKLLFEFLICTGARIEEALTFNKDGLIDDKRKSIKLYVTKRKAKKEGEQFGKPRSFEISTSLYNKLRASKNHFMFIDVIENINLNTQEGRLSLKKYTKPKSTLAYIVLRNNLKAVGIKDYYNFGLHSIRKTHGMWLKTMNIDMGEICNRLGHDTNTYLKHYGSPSLFQLKDKQLMIKVLGDIYGFK